MSSPFAVSPPAAPFVVLPRPQPASTPNPRFAPVPADANADAAAEDRP